jgi:hypothetical protein
MQPFESLFASSDERRTIAPDRDANQNRPSKLSESVQRWVHKLWTWLLTVLWACLALALLLTWITCAELEKPHFLARLIWVALSLVGLWFASGIELAYSDLRDKDPDQVSIAARSLLEEMQSRGQLVYEAREWITVALVVSLTYLSDFDKIYIPFTQLVFSGSKVRFTFTLLFSTVPAVWFAQAPAKKLAAQNSVIFLEHSMLGWLVFRYTIKAVEFFRLRAISEIFSAGFSRLWGSERRNLAPSNASFYISSLHAYGYALHELEDTVTINADGSAHLTQRGILHVISPTRNKFSRFVDYPNAEKTDLTIEICDAFSLHPLREKLEDNCESIAALLKGKTVAGCRRLSAETFLKDRSERVLKDPDKKVYTLPVHIGPPFTLSQLKDAGALCFSYKLEFDGREGNYSIAEKSEEWHSMLFEGPCRLYTCNFRLSSDVKTHFAEPKFSVTFSDNPQEDNDVGIDLNDKADGLTFRVPHPLPGAKYRFSWTYWS